MHSSWIFTLFFYRLIFAHNVNRNKKYKYKLLFVRYTKLSLVLCTLCIIIVKLQRRNSRKSTDYSISKLQIFIIPLQKRQLKKLATYRASFPQVAPIAQPKSYIILSSNVLVRERESSGGVS